ncbi:MAG: hypothetical protein IKK95_06120 [Lachnospiraceae bacterium]|nr:hypothetical protein [Lachnospiraceae bacterium]
MDHVDVYTDSDTIDLDDYIVSSGPGSFGPMAVQTDLLLGSEYAESVTAFNPIQMAAEGQTDYINSIRLDCIIDGDACTLLLPPEHIDKIFIDDQNRLWNMSTSTISGRIVDDQFNPYQTEGKLVYLTACLGNNFSSINNYGSPNYVREYYWSSSRLTYDDTYCEIIVDQYHYPFFASDMWNYAMLFALFGGVLIAWLSNWRKY